MKTLPSLLGRVVSSAMVTIGFIISAGAATIFTDDFKTGPSPRWGNEAGSWVGMRGVYRATRPANFPAAVSYLPFTLTDFSVDFDIQGVHDGGVWLRCSKAPGTALGVKGVALNLKTVDGPPRIYWHIVGDGSDYGVPLNVVPLAYGNNPHIHVEVSGNNYAAYVNGARTPATTLTTCQFPDGKVALYDFSGQSFANFTLQGVTDLVEKIADARVGTVRVRQVEAPAVAAPIKVVPASTAPLEVEPPTLAIESGLIISWPAEYSGYVLEESSSLSEPKWTRSTNIVTTVNKVVIKSPTGNKFYRLTSP